MRPLRRSRSLATTNGKITKPRKQGRENKVERKSAFAIYLQDATNANALPITDPSTSASTENNNPTFSLTKVEDAKEVNLSCVEELSRVSANDDDDHLSAENLVVMREKASAHKRYFHGVADLPNPTEMVLDKDTSLPPSSVNSSDMSDDDFNCENEQIVNESCENISPDDESPDAGVFPLSKSRSRVLLGIQDSTKIFGRGYIKVIKGRIEILGTVLTAIDKGEPFYAPVTDFALTIECCMDEPDSTTLNGKTSLPALLDIPGTEVPESAIEEFVSSYSVVVLFSSLERLDWEIYPGYADIFKLRSKYALQGLCNGACLARSTRCFKCFPSYLKATNSIISCTSNSSKDGCNLKDRFPVILTVGGKGTGKSTFNRYLVNKMLQLFPKINYLDCDIGQPEFTLPGFISLTCVQSPILGPPFTHILDPIHAIYYGRINCAAQPDRYIRCVKEVLAHWDYDAPLIVNTMGWIRGLGLNILLDLIRMVQPSHIVQISGVKESRNLPLITEDFVENSKGWNSAVSSSISMFETIPVETDLEIYEESGYNPSDLRNLRVLSYLRMIQRNCSLRDYGISCEMKFSLESLSTLKPYKVKLSDVALFVCHDSGIPRDFSLAVFNASLVGLSVITEKLFKRCSETQYLGSPPNSRCYGMGIVHGVDVEQKCLFIISHLPKEILRNVNCLMLGCLSIPECMHEPCKTGTSDISSATPYVTADFPFEVVGSGKFRVYRSK